MTKADVWKFWSLNQLPLFLQRRRSRPALYPVFAIFTTPSMHFLKVQGLTWTSSFSNANLCSAALSARKNLIYFSRNASLRYFSGWPGRSGLLPTIEIIWIPFLLRFDWSSRKHCATSSGDCSRWRVQGRWTAGKPFRAISQLMTMVLGLKASTFLMKFFKLLWVVLEGSGAWSPNKSLFFIELHLFEKPTIRSCYNHNVLSHLFGAVWRTRVDF